MYTLHPVLSLFVTALLVWTGCTAGPAGQQSRNASFMNQEMNSTDSMQKATFGTGCFWCTEAQFRELRGVIFAVSGYSGGETPDPTYKEVCTGATGHAEVIQITYDPGIISFDELLEAFWLAHDPTQLNRQGNDVGTQYRSVIFYHDESQREKAEDYKKKFNEQLTFGMPVVTEITPFSVFYKAEDYHQDYYRLNGQEPYCQMVVRPKLEKFRQVFREKLKQQ